MEIPIEFFLLTRNQRLDNAKSSSGKHNPSKNVTRARIRKLELKKEQKKKQVERRFDRNVQQCSIREEAEKCIDDRDYDDYNDDDFDDVALFMYLEEQRRMYEKAVDYSPPYSPPKHKPRVSMWGRFGEDADSNWG